MVTLQPRDLAAVHGSKHSEMIFFSLGPDPPIQALGGILHLTRKDQTDDSQGHAMCRCASQSTPLHVLVIIKYPL